MSLRALTCMVVSVFASFAATNISIAAPKPNVLFIISDDLNASLGAYGGGAKTPNLDKLAARGVRFDRAYCQFPLCGPSRASLMSGMRPERIGVLTNDKPVRFARKDVVTLPQLFRQNGYFSARVGKIYHLGIPSGVGTAGPDDPASWDHTYNPPGAEFTTSGETHDPNPKNGQSFRRVIGPGDGAEQADYQAADEAIRLLNAHAAEPFFLAIGFVRPHVPVIAPQKYFDLYAPDAIKLPTVPPNDRDDVPPAAFARPEQFDYGMTEADQRESRRAYYACVSFMDAQVGRVLDELERLKLTENTVVVFVGDHGYSLGEHRAWQKMMLFEPVARVPMLVAGPGVKPAGTKALVEMIDLYPTVAALAGLTPPGEMDGVSLVPVLNDPAAKVKDAAYTQLIRRRGGIVHGRSVRTDRWRFTEWGEGGPSELYDHQNDPNEWTNLAADPAHAATVAEMKRRLRTVFPATQPGATS